MAGKEQSKHKLLYLLQFLALESDEENGVSMKQILTFLESKGITAERKAIYRDIETLISFGYNIEKISNRPLEYALVERQFEFVELKLLADAVQSARFISQETTTKLIGKLESLTSHRKAAQLHRQVFFAKRVKSDNDHIYYITGIIHEAIHSNKCISFQYMEYLPDKTIRPRHQGEVYIVSPYSLVWNEDKYYLYAFCAKTQMVKTYRIDRMRKVDLMETLRSPEPKDFSPTDRLRKEFGMFAGNTTLVDLRFSKDLLTTVIDRFGSDITIFEEGEDSFTVHVSVDISPVFFSWLFQFGQKAEIIGPEFAIGEYRKTLQAVLNKLKKAEEGKRLNARNQKIELADPTTTIV